MVSLLRKIYEENYKIIKEKISFFNKNKKLILNKSNKGKRIFIKELLFCLLTPQSKAEKCWFAVELLTKKGMIDKPNERIIKNILKNNVRFYNKKTEYVIEALKKKEFLIEEIIKKNLEEEKRDFLIKNVKGLGLKEATHFLRNIGFTNNLAIIDRHIINYLERKKKISKDFSLNKRKYLEIEEILKKISKKENINMVALDLTIWFLMTGRIFK